MIRLQVPKLILLLIQYRSAQMPAEPDVPTQCPMLKPNDNCTLEETTGTVLTEALLKYSIGAVVGKRHVPANDLFL